MHRLTKETRIEQSSVDWIYISSELPNKKKNKLGKNKSGAKRKLKGFNKNEFEIDFDYPTKFISICSKVL